MIAKSSKLAFALALLLAPSIVAQRQPAVSRPAGISAERLQEIDSVVAESIKNQELPGAEPTAREPSSRNARR